MIDPIYLYFDTETTGFINKAKPLNDLCQPRIVQLGAILATRTRILAELNIIVKPNVPHFTIPKVCSDIHGITDELMNQFGFWSETAIKFFQKLALQANVLVAHNLQYDMGMIKLEEFCMGRDRYTTPVNWSSTFCTMEHTTDICKLPGRFRGQYKWPKLMEAYEHAFGEKFDDAHDAMADVRACRRLHLWLLDQQPPIVP